MLIPGNNDAYVRRVLATGPIAYWPLSERTGSVAYDASGNGLHGTYTGVTLGHPGIGDGRTAGYFNGGYTFVEVFSAGLASRFSGAEGAVLVWAMVPSATWSDGAIRRAISFSADSNNFGLIWKYTNFMNSYFTAGGTNRSYSMGQDGRTSWMPIMVIWSVMGGYVRWALDGVVVNTGAAPGAWAGALSSARIGITSSASTQPWVGYLAHVAWWDRAPSISEIATLGVIR